MLYDLMQGLRSLLRAPRFAVLVVLTLAIGIGGTTAVFTFVRGILLNPLDFPQADRLVLVCESHPERPTGWCGGAPGNLADWKDSGVLESVGLGRTWGFGLQNADGGFDSLRGGVATEGLFEALGTRAQLGRVFLEADMVEGGDHVALLSDRLWRERFSSDPAIVGSSINLDTEAYSIVGVLPPALEVPFLEEIELWIPLWASRREWRDWRGLMPFARLADGVTLEQAKTRLQALGDQLAADHPKTNADWGLRVESLQAHMVAPVKQPLLVFLFAVLLVLVIACANAASLLLARTASLRRDIAVRLALGSTRSRIVRLLLVQSVALAACASIVGLGLAWATVRWFVHLAPPGFPRLEEVTMDGSVLAFAVLISIGTGVAFGLLPAMHATKLVPQGGLASARAGDPRVRSRDMLVVAQLAITVILLAGAGLLAHSFINLTDWQPGFDTDNLVTFSIFPPLGKYPGSEPLVAFYHRLNEELRSVPGVTAVGEVSAGPLFGGGDGVSEFRIEGRASNPSDKLPVVAWFDCGRDYFSTLGVPLQRGRFFGPSDIAGGPPVGIINATMAKRHWGSANPIGESVTIEDYETTFEIVGVVADVPPLDPRESIAPQIYWPLEQFVRGATYVVVRTSGSPALVLPELERRMEALEPDLSVSALTTMEQRVGRHLVKPKFQMLLLGLFAGIAFSVATIGLYGSVSYSVIRRTREMGIRIAVGANNAQLLRLVLGHGLRLAAAGLVVGLLGSIALTRALRSMLVGVGPGDVPTLFAVSVLLAAVAVIACLAPARRALRVEPTTVLREN